MQYFNTKKRKITLKRELILAHLIDKLQKVDGVKIPHLVVAKSSWIDGSSYGTPQQIDVKKVAVSGYFQIDNFDNISYVV